MIRLSLVAVLLVCCVIALDGQTKRPGNQTPAQDNSGGNPPSQQAQPSTTQEVVNAAPNQPEATEEKGYGEQFIENLLTDPVVWLTIALTFLAIVQLKIYRAEIQDTRSIERAYIWIKHASPGIDEHCRVSLRVINTGNTPATVTDISMVVVLFENMKAVPKSPDYSSLPVFAKAGAGSRAFLVKDEFIAMPVRGIDADFLTAKKEPARVLAFIGFVDYIDKFGVRHRAGYGRFYTAERDARQNYASDEEFAKRVNLGFLPKPGYNYDRERRRGEGIDWDEAT